jgi:putative peptidoglycan lipid II flippase
MGRLYSSAYYALRDTRTPLRFAIIRVGLTTVLGLLFALSLPKLLGIDTRWGAAGLTASAGIAGWIEFVLLRSRMNARIGQTGLPVRYVVTLWTAGLAAGAAGFGVKLAVAGVHRIIMAALALGAFGIVYFVATIALRIPEATAVVRRVWRGRV